MGIVGLILLILVVALIIAAFLGQITWKQALLYIGCIGAVALVFYFALPRL